MKKTIAGLLSAATIAAMVAAPTTEASAWWRGGWGWGPGLFAGAVVAGAIIASRPPGYVVYNGYPQPVYAPGCYWASQPIYDPAGRVAGYTGQPVQVCPGGGPAVAAPGPGYQNFAGGPPPAGPDASCKQRFHSYDPRTGTYLGNDGQRHPCP